MSSRQDVYNALTRENEYAQGWNRDAKGHDVGNDQNWGYMDWIVFTEKYLAEAKLAWSNYTPDERAVQIRILKAAGLLVNALVNLSSEQDLLDIAGVSSTKFPILHGGLKTYQELK